MTASRDANPAARAESFSQSLAVYLRLRVLIVLFLGFAAGLPLALSGSTLLVWMSEAKVDLGTIGLFALVGTPYTLKFFWAPVVDALDVPILCRLLGRRRGWLVFAQLLLIGAIVFLAFTNPAQAPWLVALGALLVASASATQDIVIDAFRVESLDENEQAAGMASYVAAYRIGMVASTIGALHLVDAFEAMTFGREAAWRAAFLCMAGLVVVGMLTALVATEPERSKAVSRAIAAQEGDNPLRRVIAAASGAFSDFLTRDNAMIILAFVILYKLCDAFAGTMTAPFVIDLGFSRTDYANIVKGVGLAATLIGGFAGGVLAMRYSLLTCLWVGAFVQMASNLAFTWLAYMGQDYTALIAAIIAENFCGAIGTVIFVAYLSSLCKSPLHTATQFALLTAMAAVGRTYLSAGAGYLAEAIGWPAFFIVSSLVALPSLLLLMWLQRLRHFDQFDAARKASAASAAAP